MAAPIGLREDFSAVQLRALARGASDSGQVRRLLALAAIYDGATRSQAAAIGGVGLQTVRDWVLRFNVEGPQGLLTGKAPGNRPIFDTERRAAMRRIVEDGPIPAVHGVVRWRLVDLAQWLWEEFRVPISKQTLSRELRAFGFRKLSARPRHHAKDEAADAAFKKLLRAPGRSRRARGRRQAHRDLVPGRSQGRSEEQDHPPVGQARHATIGAARPAHALGLHLRRICPAQAKAAGLIPPRCDTHAMALHLEEISQAVAPGAHALVLLDQASWHTSTKLPLPGNPILLPLPAKSPELNPAENVWQFMRDNWLSNRAFAPYRDILDHCCFAWNTLVEQPWLIAFIGLRDWAHGL